MVLNRKGFFLELGDHEPTASESKASTKPETKPAKVESASKSPQPAATSAPIEAIASAPVAVASESDTNRTAESAEFVAKAKPSLTTAEAIAAELAEADSAKPEVELVTFAPQALQPGNSIRPGKRRPGNNLAGFRSMATDLFKT